MLSSQSLFRVILLIVAAGCAAEPQADSTAGNSRAGSPDDGADGGSAGESDTPASGAAGESSVVTPVTLAEIAGEWVEYGDRGEVSGTCGVAMPDTLFVLIEPTDESHATVSQISSDGIVTGRATGEFSSNLLNGEDQRTNVDEATCTGFVDQTQFWAFLDRDRGVWDVSRAYALTGAGCSLTHCTVNARVPMQRAEAGTFPSSLRDSCDISRLRIRYDTSTLETEGTLTIQAESYVISTSGCPDGAPDDTEITFHISPGNTGTTLEEAVVGTVDGFATATLLGGYQAGRVEIWATITNQLGELITSDTADINVVTRTLELPVHSTLPEVTGNDIALIDDTLYVASTDTLHVLDTSTPENPTLATTISMPGSTAMPSIVGTAAFAVIDGDLVGYALDTSAAPTGVLLDLPTVLFEAQAATSTGEQLLVLASEHGRAFTDTVLVYDVMPDGSAVEAERRPLTGCTGYGSSSNTPVTLAFANGVGYVTFEEFACATLFGTGSVGWTRIDDFLVGAVTLVPVGCSLVAFQQAEPSFYNFVSSVFRFPAPEGALPTTTTAIPPYILQSTALTSQPAIPRGAANADWSFVSRYGLILRAQEHDKGPVLARAALGSDAVANGSVLYVIKPELVAYDISGLE